MVWGGNPLIELPPPGDYFECRPCLRELTGAREEWFACEGRGACGRLGRCRSCDLSSFLDWDIRISCSMNVDRSSACSSVMTGARATIVRSALTCARLRRTPATLAGRPTGGPSASCCHLSLRYHPLSCSYGSVECL